MNTLQVFSLTTLLSISLASNAQSMYRCGNTFSQQPCGSDAKEMPLPKERGCEFEENKYTSKCIEERYKKLSANSSVTEKALPLPSDEPATAETLEFARKTCEGRITMQLKDPDSAKFEQPLRLGFRRTSGGQILRDYAVYVNAKNSYGGYTGKKRWTCSFDQLERTVQWVGPHE